MRGYDDVDMHFMGDNVPHADIGIPGTRRGRRRRNAVTRAHGVIGEPSWTRARGAEGCDRLRDLFPAKDKSAHKRDEEEEAEADQAHHARFRF